MPTSSVVEVIPGGPVSGTIRPPGSKSLTNRALLCAAFAPGRSRLSGALRSDDTEVMIKALKKIGLRVEESEGGRTIEITGIDRGSVAPQSESEVELFIGNSGTTIRFLTAALSALGGRFRLSGVPRMHQRPIGDLIDALRPICDGEVFSESPGGCPPVRIDTQGWRGDIIKVAGNVSSQFLSGLMMASPIAGKRIRIEVLGELVSRPYVEMTAAIMRDFGVTCRWTDPKEQGQSLSAASPKFEIDSGDGYISRDYEIEPDASAASYFWAAAAITGGEVTVMGLSDQALQGDVRFVDCLELMGCQVRRETDRITVKGSPVLRGIDIDMNAISDTVQTLSVVAMFADGPTTVRGVAHNRFKETDRIGDLAKELRKLGGQITETEDGLIIRPGILRPARIETYEDHRMAMSFALAGLRAPGVQISNPSCTGKTYPDYFADLEALTGRPHRWFA
ncbi:MAG: 3-phosphoshikimate 1-carboxyvinyltransferase [Planctomycetota bacterium]